MAVLAKELYTFYHARPRKGVAEPAAGLGVPRQYVRRGLLSSCFVSPQDIGTVHPAHATPSGPLTRDNLQQDAGGMDWPGDGISNIPLLGCCLCESLKSLSLHLCFRTLDLLNICWIKARFISLLSLKRAKSLLRGLPCTHLGNSPGSKKKKSKLSPWAGWVDIGGLQPEQKGLQSSEFQRKPEGVYHN